MDKHINWWKHNLKIYSPIIAMWAFVTFVGAGDYFAGQMVGSAVTALIIMNLVFLFFKKEKFGTKGYKTGFIISLVIGMVVLLYSDNANLITMAVAGLTFYLTKFNLYQDNMLQQ